MEKPILMLNYKTDEALRYRVINVGLIVLILLLLINIFFTSNTNDNSKFLNKQVELIKTEFEVYKKQNEILNKKLYEYEKILIKIDTNIINNNTKIDKIKTSTNEKINSFKSYDAVQLEKFFTDRYKK